MAVFTPKRLGGTPTQLTTSATSIYTVPASTTATVKQILVSNVSASATTFSIHLVKSGDTPVTANLIYSGIPIAASTTINIDLAQVLNTGDVISAFAGANSAVNITMSGIESV